MGEGMRRVPTIEGMVSVSRLAEGIYRCVCTRQASIKDESPLEIQLRENQGLDLQEENGRVLLSDSKIAVEVDPISGACRWIQKSTGKCLLEEAGKELTPFDLMKYTTGGEKPVIRRVKTVDGDRNFVENLKPVKDHTAYHAKLLFHFRAEEAVHGLGQAEEGIYNYRGTNQYLYQHNMRSPIPFFLSTKGYGILFDAGCLMTFHDDARGSWVYLDAVEQLDYYVVFGDLKSILKGFRILTGKATMLPKYAFGYVQSKERYQRQQELIDVAAEYRERGVGLDLLVQDWKTWKGNAWGCKTEIDTQRYPNLLELKQEMADMHVHTMVSIWPNMNCDTQDYREMEISGHLLGDLATYDAFDREAREIYWAQCEKVLHQGFDSWWCDSTEPFSGPDWNGEHMREPWERFLLVGREHCKFLGAERANLYARVHAQGIYENQRREHPKERVLNLTRSGIAGSQKYGTVLWSGDISATWDTLRKQIVEGINMSLSGMPYWTLDIGGFFTVYRNFSHRGCDCETDPSMKWFWRGDFEEGVRDPAYRELYVRWLQMGAFLPMFRSHGTDTPREIWQFGDRGDPAYEAIAKSIALRYRLMPYIYSLAGAVVQQDENMMNSLLIEFPKDRKAAACDTEFMFGHSLLVCPITEAMYAAPEGKRIRLEKTWPCYLPSGSSWYDFYTGYRYEGGQNISVEVSLDHIPLFVRAGSILPMEHRLQYASELVDTPLEIHLYTGEDGSFIWYEDDGESYAYEKGEYNQILMCWDEGDRALTIEGAANRISGGIVGREISFYVNGELKRSTPYVGEKMTQLF